MPLLALDHVNLRTTRVTEMTAFYRDVLGLVAGPRPAFPFGGAWLYCGERAVVHLVEVPEAANREGDLHLEHFAFAARGYPEFLATLTRSAVPYRLSTPTGGNARQVNIHDPDGNHIHIDFPLDE
ncbi:MAG TPA: VOC family protein [Polyangiaceae bacterium]|jgi:catechol 2,3-dioxygenase-like lactoylglutathione lyase family enzyme